MNHLIASRSSIYEDFSKTVSLKIGMCLTSRIDEDHKVIDFNLPYPDFVYIVGDIKGDKILLIDTAHNNSWEIDSKDLNACELVSEFHRQYNDIDCQYINNALLGFYKYES